MLPVGVDVAKIVDEVGGARCGAVGDERGYRLEPAGPGAELGREDDAGEEEQVLQPLPRPQCDERGPQRWAPSRKLGHRRSDGERLQPLTWAHAGHRRIVTPRGG